MLKFGTGTSVFALCMVMFSSPSPGQSTDIQSIDSRIAAVSAAGPLAAGLPPYLAEIRSLANTVNAAPLDAAIKFDRLIKLAALSLALRAEANEDAIVVLREQRNAVLLLIGLPWQNSASFGEALATRGQIAALATGFAANLKSRRISGYVRKPVFVNMPEIASEPEPERNQRYMRFIMQNKINLDSNRFQEIMSREYKFLHPKIKEFLLISFADSQNDQSELAKFLSLISE